MAVVVVLLKLNSLSFIFPEDPSADRFPEFLGNLCENYTLDLLFSSGNM